MIVNRMNVMRFKLSDETEETEEIGPGSEHACSCTLDLLPGCDDPFDP